ncbi:hypothetical protein QTI99_06295 [Clostridium perfringens]|uniref:hypothetical protein n=1 Tax=Clostridium perfringens TaxID=1502 RepID=UPI002915A77C|nr:hypothetical protein [Clostridium perfringens]EIW6613670.1 hypothetical protein [Clostridium perfringens]EJT6170731.1 hypothetical protein [Clostridium perfringens]EJT6541456.1 hypothetical protein [Clostridium perfringens]EJT6566463.1 hypothetical protein [Clostridium perfringens]MBS5994802.1 hypothetical protein [Clostridium perfringens]
MINKLKKLLIDIKSFFLRLLFFSEEFNYNFRNVEEISKIRYLTMEIGESISEYKVRLEYEKIALESMRREKKFYLISTLSTIISIIITTIIALINQSINKKANVNTEIYKTLYIIILIIIMLTSNFIITFILYDRFVEQQNRKIDIIVKLIDLELNKLKA